MYCSYFIEWRTVHSVFGIPFGKLTDESISTIKAQSKRATLIKNCALIIWDKVSMTSSLQLTVIDRLLKHLMMSDIPFGGKCVLFGGDFRQILPVDHTVQEVK